LGTNETVFTFKELGLKVYGRSFETAFLEGVSTPKLKGDDDEFINLLIHHGELKSDLDSRYNAITKDFITSSKMDYIALGHVHKRSEIGQLADTYFAYCGCPEGQGFDELGEKGVLIGEIGKNICTMEFVPLAKRLHIHEKVNISQLETNEIANKILETLQTNYGENYSENLYKIELTGTTDADVLVDIADITARISEKVYFAKVKDNTQQNIDLEALAKEKNLRGIFVKKMLEKISSAEADTRMQYETALELGLKAFVSEVKFNED
jgi:DNA repair exonuclease SbcCD nuclease subunit